MIYGLYVDTDPDVLKYVKENFKDSPAFRIDVCSSEAEVREMLVKSYYEAVIFRNSTDKSESPAFLEEIKSNYPYITCILYSGTENAESILASLNSVADKYVKQSGRDAESLDRDFKEISAKVRKNVEICRFIKNNEILSRIYKTLAQVNSATYSMRRKDEILKEICRIAVETAGFKQAWIGLADRRTGVFGEAAQYCEDDSIPKEARFLPANPMTLPGIMTGENIISEDNRYFDTFAPFRDELLKYGYASSAVFPLKIGSHVIGTLAIHSGETWAFNDESIMLIERIADNISFSIELMEKEYVMSELDHNMWSVTEHNRRLSQISDVTRHDILNQLTGLLGYIEISQMYTEDEKLLSIFKREKTAADTIHKLIAFAREYQQLGRYEPSWENLTNIIYKSSETIRAFQDCNVTLDIKNYMVYADPLFEKVIFNIFDNSIQHAGKMTEFSVKTDVVDEKLIITLKDNGRGIPEKDKGDIFGSDLSGYGKFGLSLSKAVLEVTGISICENGVEGEGASFVITVPKERFKDADN